MLPRATLAEIDASWAHSLGCQPEQLHAAGLFMLRNAGELADFAGAYLLKRDETCILSVPDAWRESAAQAAQARAVVEVFDPAFLAALFGEHVARIIGPASQSYADATTFHLGDERGTRPLTPADTSALRQLADACQPQEWEHSGIGAPGSMAFGCFLGAELAAAGMLAPRGVVRRVGIVTHPGYRGRGYGRAVVSAMTRVALHEGAIPHYQTLASNVASLAVARALGFHEYGQTLAVRLW